MANKFSVSPMSQKISLKAGDVYEGSITIANPADATEDFYFKVSVSPYSVTGTDYVKDFGTVSDRTRIVDWIILDTKNGKISPNETKKINFKIKVPEFAPAGGQYAMIGVSSDNPIVGDDSTVQNVFEMASLILADIDGDTKHDGKILDVKIPGFVASGKPKISTTIINNGNVHETASIAVRAKNIINGEVIYPKDEENNAFEAIIMPGSTRVLSTELLDLPALGIFEVSETVNYMDNELAASTIMVVCPIWFIILVIATIASFISMIFYAKYLKKRKKIQQNSMN